MNMNIIGYRNLSTVGRQETVFRPTLDETKLCFVQSWTKSRNETAFCPTLDERKLSHIQRGTGGNSYSSNTGETKATFSLNSQ